MAKPHIPLPTVCAALLAALCAASEVPSTVVTTADDVVDPEDGVVSLREAVAYAGTGTLGNTITLTDNVVLKEPLVLTKSVIVNGIPYDVARAHERLMDANVPGPFNVWCEGVRTPSDYVIMMMLNIILLERRLGHGEGLESRMGGIGEGINEAGQKS